MRYQSIIVMGPPYSGKGTQCKLLGERTEFFHFSSGDMFRNLDPSTEIGAKVKILIDAGHFVDNKSLMELTKENLKNYIREGKYLPKKQSLLLDGLPRNIAQIALVREIADINKIVYLNGGSREDLISRALNRGEKEDRIDDQDIEIITKRIDKYFRETHPILKFYHARIRTTVDSTGSAKFTEKELEKRVLEINKDLLEKILWKS
jgi:adenylate kinase